MSLPEELAGFSREELIELVGRLFGHIQVLEARIAELEGQQKPPTGVKERKPPSWVKANRPARSKGERRKRPHGFARRREEPTHRVEHATASCPDCQVPLTGGRVRGSRQVISLPRVRARVTEHVVLERACPQCRKRWAPEPDWGALSVDTAAHFGLSCLTQENLEAPWLLFEAGALSKSIENSRVVPYLYGVSQAQLQGPLAQRQAALATKDSTLDVIKSINVASGDNGVEPTRLENAFETWRPQLESTLTNIPETTEKAPSSSGGAPAPCRPATRTPRGSS